MRRYMPVCLSVWLYNRVNFSSFVHFTRSHLARLTMVQIKYTQIFYNNEWHNSVSGKTFPTLNPATEEKLADIQEGDKADAERAVAAAVAAFKVGSPWRSLEASERGQYLRRVADLIDRDRQQLCALETADNGKSLAGSDGDVTFAVKALRYFAGWADKVHGKTISADGKVFSYTKVEPVGVCGMITPWNFPVALVLLKAAPALAAGCTIVIKPAEQTPLTALHIAALFKEAGFPPGVFNVVPGYGPTAGAALVEHPQVDKISFTGSTEVGELIIKSGASTFKRVTLELGGKSPLVVTPHYDVASAAKIAHEALFFNQGQCCIAASRCYVHESIYDEFVKHAVKLAETRSSGDPTDPKVVHGPQVDDIQLAKILELIESGKKQGARVLTGGKRMTGRKGYYIEPTVFVDVKDNMRIAREEIFGPVQQILKYKDLDEVIERANDTNYGLAAGIITHNLDEMIKFSDRVRAGTVWVNTYGHSTAQIPFGGFKHSGLGRELGEEGIRIYCELKTVTIGLH